MDPNCSMRFENPPVSQKVLPPDPEMELWEAPFERWLRLADALLGNVPPVRPSIPRKI